MQSDIEVLSGILCKRQPDWEKVLLSCDGCTLVTFCNPLSLAFERKHPGFLSLLREFDLVFADGILLSKVASIVTEASVPRVSFDGNSLAAEIFSIADRYSLPLALIGGREGVAQEAASILGKSGYHVKYSHCGYFLDSSDENACLSSIASLGIRIVLVGMGGVVQEEFALKLKASGWRGVVFTCGGYLDQLAVGKMLYYPEIINYLHLRALYRVWKEPRRMIPRYTLGYLPFYKSLAKVVLLKLGFHSR